MRKSYLVFLPFIYGVQILSAPHTAFAYSYISHPGTSAVEVDPTVIGEEPPPPPPQDQPAVVQDQAPGQTSVPAQVPAQTRAAPPSQAAAPMKLPVQQIAPPVSVQQAVSPSPVQGGSVASDETTPAQPVTPVEPAPLQKKLPRPFFTATSLAQSDEPAAQAPAAAPASNVVDIPAGVEGTPVAPIQLNKAPVTTVQSQHSGLTQPSRLNPAEVKQTAPAPAKAIPSIPPEPTVVWQPAPKVLQATETAQAPQPTQPAAPVRIIPVTPKPVEAAIPAELPAPVPAAPVAPTATPPSAIVKYIKMPAKLVTPLPHPAPEEAGAIVAQPATATTPANVALVPPQAAATSPTAPETTPAPAATKPAAPKPAAITWAEPKPAAVPAPIVQKQPETVSSTPAPVIPAPTPAPVTQRAPAVTSTPVQTSATATVENKPSVPSTPVPAVTAPKAVAAKAPSVTLKPVVSTPAEPKADAVIVDQAPSSESLTPAKTAPVAPTAPAPKSAAITPPVLNPAAKAADKTESIDAEAPASAVVKSAKTDETVENIDADTPAPAASKPSKMAAPVAKQSQTPEKNIDTSDSAPPSADVKQATPKQVATIKNVASAPALPVTPVVAKPIDADASAPPAPAKDKTQTASLTPDETKTSVPDVAKTAETKHSDTAPVAASAPQDKAADKTPAVPSMSDLTLPFETTSSTLSAEAQKKLDGLARQVQGMGDLRLQIRGFAKGNDQSSERRMALSRVLVVRSYLMDKGIKPDRLDVQALGSETDKTPVDRVDIVFTR